MTGNRYPALLERPVRAPQAVLDENLGFYKGIHDQAKARLTAEGQSEVYGKLEKAIAAGEPGLMTQQIPNYINEESLVRSFVLSFGQIVQEGQANQVPEYTIAEPNSIKVLTAVAVTLGKGQARRRVIYKVIETQSKGAWKEFSTEPAEIPFINDFFPGKRAILVAQAAEKLSYFQTKELDKIAFAFIGVGGANTVLKTTFAAADKIWTFKDPDVKGRPAGNKDTSTASFWKTLRTKVIPYVQGVGKAGQVINIHILHTDLQFLFQVAPLGATLGGYSQFQTAVYEGNIQDISIYGHRFRIIPENWNIATGEMYVNVGPVFKMWLPPSGDVALAFRREDGSEVRILSRVYEVLSPSPWWTNVYYTTWSTTDTSG